MTKSPVLIGNTQKCSRIITAKPEFYQILDEMLVAFTTGSLVILSPGMAMPVLRLQSYKRKGPNWPFFFVLLGTISDYNAGFLQWRAVAEMLNVVTCESSNDI